MWFFFGVLRVGAIFRYSFVCSVSGSCHVLVLVICFQRGVFYRGLGLFFGVLLVSKRRTRVGLSFFGVYVGVFQQRCGLSKVSRVFHHVFRDLCGAARGGPGVFGSRLLFFVRRVRHLFQDGVGVSGGSTVRPLCPTLRGEKGRVSHGRPCLVKVYVSLVLAVSGRVVVVRVPLVFYPRAVLFPRFSRCHLHHPRSTSVFRQVCRYKFPFYPRVPTRVTVQQSHIRIVNCLRFFSRVYLNAWVLHPRGTGAPRLLATRPYDVVCFSIFLGPFRTPTCY